MAANETTKPTEPHPGSVIHPQPVLPQQQVVAGFAQLTQVAAYVPAQVWTTEALLDYHQKLHDVIMDNNRKMDDQRKREHSMAKIVLVGFAGILAVGFYFAYLKIDLGRDIVISAVSAGLGYAAGYGTGLLKRQ